jgi:hypothetical protein
MLTSMPLAPPIIRIEIEVSGELLAALQKLVNCFPLSNAYSGSWWTVFPRQRGH